MDKSKPHRNWKLFLENQQLPLGPLKGAPIKARPSMRVDPDKPDPDHERKLDPEELALMLQRANDENPARYQQQSDSDFFGSPTSDTVRDLNLKIGNVTDFEAADTWDIKDDEKIRKAMKDFKKLKANLPTLDLKKLEEMIREELIRLINETDIHRKK